MLLDIAFARSVDPQPSSEVISSLSTLLSLPVDSLTTAFGPSSYVFRGESWSWPPKDPVLVRLYEVLIVYGMSYKAIIAEKVSFPYAK